MIPEHRQHDLEKLLYRLGLTAWDPLDWELLDQALVHPLLDPVRNNDRLEFFGDVVLRLVATEFLYAEHPQGSVGLLSELRADLVSDAHLTELADSYGLDRFLAVGPSVKAQDLGRASRLADALEAILGALYLSWGHTAVTLQRLHTWLDPHFCTRSQQFFADPTRRNPKAALQELTQAVWTGVLPDYRLCGSQSQPPWFEVEVWCQGRCWGQGSGSSKKAAEMMAAKQAFLAMQQEGIGIGIPG
ncbi:MAG: ribonuclease III family protein [Cyanophyceae cyanobacterium]